MKKLVKESLVASLNEEVETYTIEVKVRKTTESDLKEMLEYIGKNGNTGHSFRIVVDPDTKENTKEFYWDGDGADYIESVTVK